MIVSEDRLGPLSYKQILLLLHSAVFKTKSQGAEVENGDFSEKFHDLNTIIGATCTVVPSGSPLLSITRTQDLCERERPSFPVRLLPQTHQQMTAETMP